MSFLNRLFNSNAKNKAPFIALAAAIFMIMLMIIIYFSSSEQTEEITNTIEDQNKNLSEDLNKRDKELKESDKEVVETLKDLKESNREREEAAKKRDKELFEEINKQKTENKKLEEEKQLEAEEKIKQLEDKNLQPPSPPENLKIVNVDDDLAIVSWEKDLNTETEIESFLIILMPDSEIDEVISDNKQTQKFEWNNLERNKDYWFEIKSIGVYSASESISSDLFRLQDKPKPPKNIYIQNLGNEIELIWSAPVDDNGIILNVDSFQIRNNEDQIISTIDASEENVTRISDLVRGNTYQFYVVSEINGEISEPSMLSEEIIIEEAIIEEASKTVEIKLP